MSEQEMKKDLEQFLQIAAQDPELQEKFKAASDKNTFIRLMVELGSEKGYSFTSDQVETTLEATEQKAVGNDVSVLQLSDRELTSIVGSGHKSNTIGHTGVSGYKSGLQSGLQSVFQMQFQLLELAQRGAT